MSKVVIEYAAATGQIISCCTVPHIEWAGEPISGCVQMEVAYPPDAYFQYVVDNEIVDRRPFSLQIDKPQIVADGNDTVTISNVPVGTTIIWHDGQEDVVNDGQVQLSTDLPGTYTLTFDAVPFLRQEVTIEAVAAT